MGRKRQTSELIARKFPNVGERFDERYQLEAQLGSGGGSAVFKALDTRLSRQVAIKVLSPDEMDTQGIERFRREAISIARLTHPGIVTIYDFSEAGKLPYLVLELVNGVDLWAVIYDQQRELTQEESVKICLNILDALEYAHENGVIHRDLKPENVMVVDDELHVKVTDFGLAYIRGQRRITREGVVAGSAFYMAPEVASGEASDQRSDLYALGVMLYELITGRLPFYSENPLAVISMHLYDAPRPPSEIRPGMSPVLEAIILKLLAKRPDDRFTSAEEVYQALENLEQEQLKPEAFTQQHLLDQIDRRRPIGRDAEWTHLRECWQEVVLGSGVDAHPVVMVAGKAGSGKNQLVHQLLIEARLTGACVLNTQCFMTAAPLPYQPIIELLRQYLRTASVTMNAAMAADLARLVPEIADEFEVEVLPSLTPEAERLRLYEHITQFMIEIAQQQPLLIVIEYLHSADSSTLELLHYLARNISRLPILIIGTYRPSELDYRHALDVLLRELISQDLVEQIPLRRMSPEEVRQFIDAIFGNGVAPALAQMIFDRTHGNIFFTREMLKSLVLDGHIYPDAEHNTWHVKEIDVMQLPNSIRSVIRHLLGKLSETAMEVLPTAAVIGHEFSFTLLMTVSEQNEDTIWNVLEEALSARIINEKKNSREEIYTFENLAIHETLLESLHQRTRSRLHLKIARALEARYPHQIQDNIETIARHYSLGARTDEDIDRAIQYLEQAADHAARIFALTNALDLYNIALDLSQDDVSPQREARILQLRERRGTIHQQIGDFDAAAADLEAVLQASPVNHDTSHKRAVLLQLGQVYRRAERFEQAIKALKDAVEISRTMDNETLVADALFFLGATYWSLGQINQALRHQEEAYEIVTRLQLEDEIAMRVLHGLAECFIRRVDYPRMFSLAEQSLGLARKLGNMEYQSENLMIMGTVEVDRGSYERAMSYFEEDAEVCRRSGLRWHLTTNEALYGLAKASSGDYDTGIKIMKGALEYAEPRYKGFALTMILGNLGRAYLDLEALDEAEEVLSKAIARSRRHKINWSAAAVSAFWAMLQIRKGNLEVGSLLEEVLQESLENGDLRHVPMVYRTLAELEIARGIPQFGLQWAEEMRRIAIQLDQPIQKVQADRWRAEAMLALDQLDEARLILEGAVEAAVAIKSPRLMWDLHRTLGNVYEKLDEPAKAARCRVRVRSILNDLSEEVSSPELRRHLRRETRLFIESQKLTGTLRLLVVSDALGSMVQDAIREHMDEVLRCDALVVLGDLPSKAYPILREELELDMRGLCVLGNHDDASYAEWLPRYKFEYLHTALATLRIGGRDITFGGFSGSERYKSGLTELQWDDRDASRAIKELPYCDILLTHTAPEPPPGYQADRNHRGLPAIDEYIQRHKPRVVLHGHFHQNYHQLKDDTWMIGCFGAVLVQCMIIDEEWQVEVQPLLAFT